MSSDAIGTPPGHGFAAGPAGTGPSRLYDDERLRRLTPVGDIPLVGDQELPGSQPQAPDPHSET
jgi:hypothetical protein